MKYSPLLTHEQFGKTKAAKSGGTYQRYVSYVQNTRKARAAQRSSVNAAQTAVSKKAQQPSTAYLNPIPYRTLQKQAQDYIAAQFGAPASAIQQNYAAQSKASTSNILSVAQQLMKNLGGLPSMSDASYTKAMTDQALIDSALTNFIQGQGNAAAENVGSQLSAINAPGGASSPLATNISGLGQNAAAVAMARGTADLSLLNAQKQAQGSYLRAQPGIAMQDAIERAAASVKALGLDEQQAITDLYSKQPGQAADFMQNLLDRETQKAVARQGYGVDMAKINAANQPMPDASLSNSYGYAVDQYGQPILDAKGHPIPAGSIGHPKKTTAAAYAKVAAKRQSRITAAQKAAASVAQKAYTSGKVPPPDMAPQRPGESDSAYQARIYAALNNTGKEKRPVDNAKAYQQVVAALNYYLSGLNLPPARIASYARQALVAAGYAKFANPKWNQKPPRRRVP